jgi:hypothetical protein
MFSDLSHLGALAHHVLGLTYSKHLGASGSGGAFAMGGRFLALCWTDLTLLGILAVVSGFVIWARNAKTKPLFLWAGLVWAILDLGLLLTVPYPALETHQVLWPWVFLAFFAAMSLGALWERTWSGKWERWVFCLLAFFALVQFLNIHDILKKRADRTAEDYASALLSVMPRGSIYFASTDNDYFPVIGMQDGYGLRPDVTVVSPGDPRPGEKIDLPRRIQRGAPAVAFRLVPGLSKQLVPIPLGPLWLYAREPACQVESAGSGNPVAVWPGVELCGFESDHVLVRKGGVLTFHYVWRRVPGRTIAGSRQAVVLLVDDQGNYPMSGGGLWLHDTHDLLNDWFALSDLDPRKTYAYDRKLFVPSNFPPGKYRVIMALQPAAPPSKGTQEAGGEFYGDGSWQAAWQFGGRGTWDGTEHMTAGKGADQLILPVGGTAPRMLGKFAVVGRVEIQ